MYFEKNRAITNIKHIFVFSETCKNLDLRQGGNKAWKLLHNMSGDRRPTNSKPFIDSDNEELVSDKKKSEYLNKHFAAVSKSERKCTLDRGLKNLK